MTERTLHTFEAGRRGKPDELEGGIAHLIGALFLELNPLARFDLRVGGRWSYEEEKPFVEVSGEVSESILTPNLEESICGIVIDHYNKVHRTALTSDDLIIRCTGLKPQSDVLASNGSAGDSGNPIAVAYRNAPNHLPWERYLAVEIRDIIDNIFQNGNVPAHIADISGVKKLNGLRADGKVSVDAIYEGVRLCSLADVTIAVEHERSLGVEELREKLETMLHAYFSELGKEYGVCLGTPNITINGAGAWNRGGWRVDEGSREAKPYRDSFSSYGAAEDSFSGEDPTKPSATGTFVARSVAVAVVKHFSAFARVALTYKIGKDDVGLNITTNGTATKHQDEIEQAIRDSIKLGIGDAISSFGLLDPKLYRAIVESSDFFHNPKFPWNQTALPEHYGAGLRY